MSYPQERVDDFWRDTYKRWDAAYDARRTEQEITRDQLRAKSAHLTGLVDRGHREFQENRLLETMRRQRNLIERQLTSDRRILEHHRSSWLADFEHIDFSKRTAGAHVDNLLTQVRGLLTSPTASIAALLLHDTWNGPNNPFPSRLSASLMASRAALEELAASLGRLLGNEQRYWRV